MKTGLIYDNLHLARGFDLYAGETRFTDTPADAASSISGQEFCERFRKEPSTIALTRTGMLAGLVGRSATKRHIVLLSASVT